MLLRLDVDGVITKCVTLPSEFPDQVRYGFEGVAQDGDYVVIPIQREWGDEEHPRIAVYNHVTEEWKYVFYALDEVESQYGGWVGLSDVAPVGDGNFLILERDDQAGPDAVVKRVYQIGLGDFSFEDGSVVDKSLVKDLMEDLLKGNGSVIEKVEGLAVTSDGNIWINTDNDGVDDNSGEQILMNVGQYTVTSGPPPTVDVPFKDIMSSISESDDVVEDEAAATEEDPTSSAVACKVSIMAIALLITLV
jgi:hypothetical protein